MAVCQIQDQPIGKEQKNKKAEKVRAVCQEESCKTSRTKCIWAKFLNTAEIVCFCNTDLLKKFLTFGLLYKKSEGHCHRKLQQQTHSAILNPARPPEHNKMNTKPHNTVMIFKTAPTFNQFLNTQPDASQQRTSALHALWELSTASEWAVALRR